MERIDEHEVRAEAVPGPRGEISEVGKVADAPRPSRSDRVDLRHEPPEALGRGERGRMQSLGRDDEHGLMHAVIGVGLDRMPPQRDIGRHDEGRLTDELTVDLAGVHPPIALGRLDNAPVLQFQPDAHRGAMRHVGPDVGIAPPDRDDYRGKGPAPVTQVALAQARPDRVLIGGVRAEGAQHGGDGVVTRPAEHPGLIPVLDGHAVRGGKFVEGGAHHTSG